MTPIENTVPVSAHLASSVAGAQRVDADADHRAGSAAEQKVSADQREMTAATLGDVAHAESSADRDADGWLSYEEPPADREEHEKTAPGREVQSAPDAFGERGRGLDLEA